MLSQNYFKQGVEMLNRLQDTELENISRAAKIIVEATAQGHTFYAWGGPHSSLPVQDIFYRAGGLAMVNAVFTPSFCLEIGPIRLTSFLERAEGYGSEFFEHVEAESGDVILLVSTSGRNAFPIEMAMAAKQNGLMVIGMTSLTYSDVVPSRHSSGKKMYEYCDVFLDNLTAPGDACIEDEKLPQKVGATSGWVGCFLLQALMVEVASQLADNSITPPVYYAANLDGQEEYREYQDRLMKEHRTKFGGIYSPVRKIE